MTLRRATAAVVILAVSTACTDHRVEQEVAAELGQEVASIGVLEGNAAETLGGVDDLSVGPDGEVFILDAKNFLLRRFSARGDPWGQVGSEGDGPGEFGWPASVESTSDGRVVVLSLAHRNLARFAETTEGLRFVDAPRLPFLARDICFLGDRVYLLALHEGNLVHEVSLGGELLRSFGEPIPYPVSFPMAPEDQLNEILDEYSAMGHLLCHGPTASVLLIPYNLPNLRAWSADGELLWETVLDGYSQTQMKRIGNAFTMGVDPETGVANATISLFQIDDLHVGLQTVEVSMGVPPSEAPVQSYAVELRGGAVRRMGASLPRIKAYRDGVAYAWEESPFPRVRILGLTFRWN